MGCTTDRVYMTNFIETPLITSIELLPTNKNPELNSKFKEAELQLQEIERIRLFTITNKIELLYFTGGCCKLNPTFLTVIESLLLILATESKGNVYSRQLYFNEGEEPYFSIQNSTPLNTKISTVINEYIKKALGYQARYKKLKQNCEEKLNDFKTNYLAYRNDIIKVQRSEEPTIAKSLVILEKNVHLINQLAKDNLLIEVIKSLEQDYKDIKKIGELINNKAYIKKLNDQGIQSMKYQTNQYDIVYNNLEVGHRLGETSKIGELLFRDKLNTNH